MMTGNAFGVQFLAERSIFGRNYQNENAVALAPGRRVKKHHRRAGQREIVRDEKQIEGGVERSRPIARPPSGGASANQNRASRACYP